MNIVMSCGGSIGDVLPYLAVGRELKRRGHEVTLVSNPSFEPWAREAALAFLPVGTLADHQRLLSDADLWDPKGKSLERVRADYYYPHLFGYYEAVLKSSAPSRTVIIGGDAGGMTVAEQLGVPLAHIVCAPAISPFTHSRYDPPHPERVLPRWLAGTGWRLSMLYRLNELRHGRFRTAKRSAPLPAGHPIARLRAHAGLTPQTRFVPKPQLVLCMWPDWFAPRQRDWPGEALTTGFPFYPPPKEAPRRTTDWLTDEEAPIVVTTGSLAGSRFAFYEMVVEAVKAFRRPVVLVSPHRNHVPPELPPNVTWTAHAPFSELFARAALVVHHGGIGTAAYGLACGVPQIVMPMRWDQFDTGNRLQRLGVGRMLPHETAAAKLAKTVQSMLQSRPLASRCRHWHSRIDVEAGVVKAADAVEAQR